MKHKKKEVSHEEALAAYHKIVHYCAQKRCGNCIFALGENCGFNDIEDVSEDLGKGLLFIDNCERLTKEV